LEFGKVSKTNKILNTNKKSHQFYQSLKICEKIIGEYIPNYIRRDYDSKLYAEGLRYSVIGMDIPTPIGEQPEISKTKWQTRIWKTLARRFNSSYLLGDGRFLPFQTELFDVVIAYAVIEHIPHNIGGLTMLLNEVNRILKRDGLFFIFRCPREQSYIERFASILKMEHHEKLFSENTIARLLEEHHFCVKEIERTDLIPAFPPKMLQRMWNFLWLPLSCLDRILLKTPLSQISHHIYVIARKKSIKEV